MHVHIFTVPKLNNKLDQIVNCKAILHFHVPLLTSEKVLEETAVYGSVWQQSASPEPREGSVPNRLTRPKPQRDEQAENLNLGGGLAAIAKRPLHRTSTRTLAAFLGAAAPFQGTGPYHLGYKSLRSPERRDTPGGYWGRLGITAPCPKRHCSSASHGAAGRQKTFSRQRLRHRSQSVEARTGTKRRGRAVRRALAPTPLPTRHRGPSPGPCHSQVPPRQRWEHRPLPSRAAPRYNRQQGQYRGPGSYRGDPRERKRRSGTRKAGSKLTPTGRDKTGTGAEPQPRPDIQRQGFPGLPAPTSQRRRPAATAISLRVPSAAGSAPGCKPPAPPSRRRALTSGPGRSAPRGRGGARPSGEGRGAEVGRVTAAVLCGAAIVALVAPWPPHQLLLACSEPTVRCGARPAAGKWEGVAAARPVGPDCNCGSSGCWRSPFC